jgi:hypothetical protein
VAVKTEPGREIKIIVVRIERMKVSGENKLQAEAISNRRNGKKLHL